MKSIAIASAKGGVGKTNLSVGLAIALARSEHKVLLVDADFGLANIDILLKLKPAVTLKHVVCDAVDLKSAITEGPEGVSVVCGGSGIKELASIEPELVQELLTSLEAMEKDYDTVVYDTGSGIGDATMTVLAQVDCVAIVCTPDPTSVMDAYATAKILYAKEPEANVVLIVNMADDEKEGEVVFGRFKSIIGQFLNKEVTLAGVVCFDDAVRSASRDRTSVMIANPRSSATTEITALAAQLSDPVIKEEEDIELALLQRMRGVLTFVSKMKLKKSEPEEESKAA